MISSIIDTDSLTGPEKLRLLATQGPAPPAGFIPPSITDPNYVAPNRAKGIIIASVVSGAVAFIVVIARLIIRAFRKGIGRWGADDWWIIPGAVSSNSKSLWNNKFVLTDSCKILCLMNCVQAVAQAVYGGSGKHAYDLTWSEACIGYQVRSPSLSNVNKSDRQ
jgi:hypothetical protein